jgi:hypothetical protein
VNVNARSVGMSVQRRSMIIAHTVKIDFRQRTAVGRSSETNM